MLTLLEASKLVQNPLQRGVVEIFASTSPVLERLPFLDVPGGAYVHNIEETLPGVAFRDFNQGYDSSYGVVQQSTEVLKIFGGKGLVDRALVKTQGNLNDLRAIQDNMRAKSLSLDWTKNFFKGDSQSDPKSFDGLQRRITGPQVLAAGNSSGGDELTLSKLDELLDAVQGGPDVLFMSKTMRRKLNALRRAAGQATEVVSDVFGRQIDAYASIPIGIVENDATGEEILGFDEANPGGGAPASSSIYACKLGVREYVSGIQAGPIEVIDLGLVDIHWTTDIEWISSFVIFNPRSAARLHGIKNA